MLALCIVALGLSGLPYATSQAFQFGRVTRSVSSTGSFYAPNPGLDPYWVGGEWVYGSTLRPGQVKATTRPGPPSGRLLVCGRPCARVYKKLTGHVCVHKLDHVYDPVYDGRWKNTHEGFIDWRLGGVLDRNYDYMRDFTSYCAFLDAQCRSNVMHGYGYAFLHMGKCLRDEEAFPTLMHGINVRDRKRKTIYDYNVQVYQPGTLHLVVCWFVYSSCRFVVSANSNTWVRRAGVSAGR